jgi:hypothetical protein
MRFSLFPGFVIFCLLLLQTGRSALVGCYQSAALQAALSLRIGVCLLLFVVALLPAGRLTACPGAGYQHKQHIAALAQVCVGRLT